MGKYILYAGILSTALSCGANAAEGHLFSFRCGKDTRAEIREMQAGLRDESIFKKLGAKKYLIKEGERVVMLDLECHGEGQVISRNLVERIEREATEILRKKREHKDREEI